jgi:uncharacterized protein (TIGR00369 family)
VNAPPVLPRTPATGLELFEFYRDGRLEPVGVAALLAIRYLEVEDGRILLACDSRSAFANPLGLLDGGIAATLLDSAMGCAVHTTLPANQAYSSLDISVRHIRSGAIDGGELRAEGRVMHRGRKVRTAEATLHDEAGRLIATATSSLMVLPLGQSAAV